MGCCSSLHGKERPFDMSKLMALEMVPEDDDEIGQFDSLTDILDKSAVNHVLQRNRDILGQEAADMNNMKPIDWRAHGVHEQPNRPALLLTKNKDGAHTNAHASATTPFSAEPMTQLNVGLSVLSVKNETEEVPTL